jgi:hypothetical protein
MKRGGMTRVPVPCSRSAHDQNVLARRPQWDQHGCHSMRGERASSEGSLMRAVKDSLAAPLRTNWENWKTLARANGTSREIDCEAIGG